MPATTPERFAALTDAAITLIAEAGMRGLTHRAVDTASGLPAGTASAYFRTRRALIEAVVQRLADLDEADLAGRDLPTGQRPGDPAPGDPGPGDPGPVDPVPGDPRLGDLRPGDPRLGDPWPGDPWPGDPGLLAAGIAALLDTWLTTGRNRSLARYACLLESTHHPQLRTILRYGTTLRVQAEALLAALGAPDARTRGNHFVAAVDGLLFDRLAGAGSLTAPEPGTDAGRADLTEAVHRLLRAAIAPG